MEVVVDAKTTSVHNDVVLLTHRFRPRLLPPLLIDIVSIQIWLSPVKTVGRISIVQVLAFRFTVAKSSVPSKKSESQASLAAFWD